jgi:outer membrane protein assembly factor BamA
VSYDTRDNNFDARQGLFCEASIVPYGPALGSTYTATVSTVDLRAYASIDSGWSLAARAYLQNAAGTPTFQMWPFIGGNTMLRGVFEAQQRDRMSALASIETRFPIVWKFRGVVFADAGQVGAAPSAFTLPGVWVGWGGGLRFVFDDQERVSLRLDVGVARGTPQFYLSFNEAF